MRITTIVAAGAAIFLTQNTLCLPVAGAQDTRSRARGDMMLDRIPWISAISPNRAVIGVSLAEPSRADTLGVRIADVDTNGPAAKAGLKTGELITAINGVSLRVSGADAGDPQLSGLAERRLMRTLQQAKPGDEVQLSVMNAGQTRSVRVKTVSASELMGTPVRNTISRAMGMNSDRPAIGISLGTAGSQRDTLGLFVNSVVAGGPAEKAGILEGQRIASINGVDLRVPREDVDDMASSSARINRFTRELEKLTAGDKVTLRVWGGDRYREVAVTTVKQSELPSRGFRVNIGDGQVIIGGAGRDEARLFSRDGDPRVFRFDGLPNGQIRIDGFDNEAFRKSMEELRVQMQQLGRDLPMRLRSLDSLPEHVRVAPRIRTVRPLVRTTTPRIVVPAVVRARRVTT